MEGKRKYVALSTSNVENLADCGSLSFSMNFFVDDSGNGSWSMKMVQSTSTSEGFQTAALIVAVTSFPAAATNQSRLQQYAFQVHKVFKCIHVGVHQRG